MRKGLVLPTALLALFVLGMDVPSSDASSILYNPGTIQEISSVIETSSGADMNGMPVTFVFEYGGKSHSQTVSWKAKPGRHSKSGAATVVDGRHILVRLTESGDTGSKRGVWTLAISRGVHLSEVVVSGLNGCTVFDTSLNGSAGTLGSGAGGDFSVLLPRKFSDINVAYNDQVKLQESTGPIGDLYATMHLQLIGKGGQGVRVVRFRAETDRAVASEVPIPSSLLMVSSGLLGLLLRRENRKRHAGTSVA